MKAPWSYCILSFCAFGILGFGIGYAAMSYQEVANSPVGLNSTEATEPLAKVFSAMARLGEAEAALASCRSGSDRSSEATILRAESELIKGLRSDAKSAGLTPPLDLAEAILLLRQKPTLIVAGLSNGGVSETRMFTDLMRRSGWSEGSDYKLPEALAKIDGVCK